MRDSNLSASERAMPADVGGGPQTAHGAADQWESQWILREDIIRGSN